MKFDKLFLDSDPIVEPLHPCIVQMQAMDNGRRGLTEFLVHPDTHIVICDV